MARIHKTRYTILGMLSIRPMSGYDIKKTISQSIAHFWAESDGQLYPTLNTLLKEGMIKIIPSSVKQKRQSIHYQITKLGKQELNTWLSREPEKTVIRHELLLKLYFANNTSPENIISHLKDFEQSASKKLKNFNEIANRLSKTDKKSPHTLFWLMTLDYGRDIINTQLNWCQKTIKTLEKLKD